MAISIKHKKVSAVADEADTSLVRPSDWNDTHDATGIAASGANSDITSLSGVTGGISTPQFIQMDNGNAETLVAGKLWYTPNTGAWNLGMGGGNITQQVGEELFVYGKASSAITDSPLQIIYQTGAVGASAAITFAPTVSGITNGDLILGVATESIALNGFGRVTSFGIVHGITTNGTAFGETWADGDAIWYNPVTGNPTNIKPVAPNIKVQVGTLIKAGSGGSGSIQVEVNHGSVLGGTDSNVQLTSVANGNILTYDGTNAYWKNTDIASGTGISVSKSATGVLTITNTSPSSGGTVTSVSGTAPIASTGGTTPTISISQATTSTNGYLSSTDWNTFNNKQPSGTYVTSVSATSPVTSTGGTTPTIAIPQATGSVSGYLSSTDWTTFNSKGSGTVTSVGLTAGTGISVSGSPITSSGSITVTNSSPMTYPGSGIAVSTGSAWGTSLTAPNGTIVGTTDTQTLTNKTFTGYTETVYAVVDAAGVALSPTNGTIQTWTLGANRTPTAGTWAAGQSMTLMIDDGTAFTVTWTTLAVTWVGGSAPTLATTGYTIVELWKVGTTIYGALVGYA